MEERCEYACFLQVPVENCGFFMWRDEPTSNHLKDLLSKPILRKMYIQRYHKVVKERDILLHELDDLQGQCEQFG